MATLITTTGTHKQVQGFNEPIVQPGSPMALPLNSPAREDVHQFVDALFDFLFPINCQQIQMFSTQNLQLIAQFQNQLKPLNVNNEAVTDAFFATLPRLCGLLLQDATAALEYDPAANSLEEVIFAYPGFYAITIYRLAHELLLLDVPLLPRMWSEYAHSKTGIDIHPAAQVGTAFVIDHGTGTVIGATAIIGDHVILYHGVTLGALHVNKSLANIKRHPTVEDHVTIYANATVLGGETIIGHHSVLGGNVWVTGSITPYSTVYYDGQTTVHRQQNSDF